MEISEELRNDYGTVWKNYTLDAEFGRILGHGGYFPLKLEVDRR